MPTTALNSGLIRDYAEGKPIVALAAILQHSAVTWLVLERPDIRNLHDLVGKRLMTVFPLSESIELLAPFESEGIRQEQLNLVPTGFDLRPLIKGEIDAYDTYVTNEPFNWNNSAFAISSPILAPMVSTSTAMSLFTSRNELIFHPERVQAFRSASLKGWHYAMNNIPETIAVIRRHYAPEKSVAQLYSLRPRPCCD